MLLKIAAAMPSTLTVIDRYCTEKFSKSDEHLNKFRKIKSSYFRKKKYIREDSSIWNNNDDYVNYDYKICMFWD